MDNLEQVDDDELENIIERAREMEDHYGHYFDMIIIYRRMRDIVITLSPS